MRRILRGQRHDAEEGGDIKPEAGVGRPQPITIGQDSATLLRSYGNTGMTLTFDFQRIDG